MADRQLPELRTRIRLDTKELERAKRTAQEFVKSLGGKIDTKSLEDFSRKADQFGDKASRNVTLPLLAAGAASAKLAVDFNTAFTQMQTLAGVTGDEVAGLKEEVKRLAVETGRSPDELAKALYFIRSSGLEGADALKVLDASAKGAAIGLGDTASVADAVTSAINTYGAANLDGATAVDVLSAAVAAGKGEASEFAPQLGRLLPLANNLGVGFDQVAGSLAFLTKTSGDTSLASAQLGGVLAAFLKPTEQGRKQLDEMGLSADGLRKSLADNGLLPTLGLVADKLGGNKDALGRLFEDREALTGFLGLTQNAEEAAAVLDSVTGAAGKLDAEFGKLDDDPGFKLNQQFSELKVTMIDVGEKLLPSVIRLAEVGGDVLGFFAALPAPLQDSLLVVLALAAGMGPLAKGASVATNTVSALMKAAKSDALFSFATAAREGAGAGQGFAASAGNIVKQAGGMPAVLGAAAVGVGLLVAAYIDTQNEARKAEEDVGSLLSAIEGGASPTDAFNDKLNRLFSGADGGFNLSNLSGDEFRELLDVSDIGLEELSKGLLGTQAEFDALIEKVKAVGVSGASDLLATELEQFRGRANDATTAAEKLAAGEKILELEADAAAEATRNQTGITIDLGDAADATAEELADMASEARDLFEAQQASAKSAEAVIDATEAISEARVAGAEAEAEAAEAVGDAEASLADAQRASADAAAGVAKARGEAAEALEDMRLAASGAIVSEQEAQTALLRAQQEARDLDTADPIARREAADKVAAAQQALAEARDKRGDTAQELADAQRKGVEGSDAVVAAQDRVRQSADAERDAQDRVGEASARVAEVRRESAQKVEDATRALVDAELAHIDNQADLTEKLYGSKAANDVLLGGLLTLSSTLDPANPLRDRIRGFAEDLQALQRAYNVTGPTVTIDDKGRLSQSIASLDGYRAQGGPVYPGRAYAVNENVNSIVPEVFVPDVPGRIVRDGGGTGPSIQVDLGGIHLSGEVSAATVALVRREVDRGVASGIRAAVAEVKR